MSTFELDKLIHDFIISKGAVPSSLGYCGFTGSACISINSELIHGIPSKKKIIKEGAKLEKFTLSREEAIKFMEERQEPYKVELINDLPEDA